MELFFSGANVAFWDNVEDSGNTTTYTGVETPFVPTDVIRITIDDSFIDANGEFLAGEEIFISEMVVIRNGVEYQMRIDDGKIKESGDKEQGDAYFQTDTQFELPSNWPGSFAGDDMRMLFAPTVDLVQGSNSFQRVVDFDFNGDGDTNDPAETGNGVFNVNTICFAAGTLILAKKGEVAVEDLAIGDMVHTRDNGFRPIRWIGKATVDANTLAMNEKLRPIRIRAGALGPDLPLRDLVVSRQHRMLICSKIADRMFEASEVLIPAVKLLALDGVEIDTDCTEVAYFHVLLDAHQIVWANGAPSESLLPGPEALKSLSREEREEIATLFPEICAPDFQPVPVRVIPRKGARIKQLIARHKKNDQLVLETQSS